MQHSPNDRGSAHAASGANNAAALGDNNSEGPLATVDGATAKPDRHNDDDAVG